MGGRIKLKDGSGKTPMTPKQKKFAALAPPSKTKLLTVIK